MSPPEPEPEHLQTYDSWPDSGPVHPKRSFSWSDTAFSRSGMSLPFSDTASSRRRKSEPVSERLSESILSFDLDQVHPRESNSWPDSSHSHSGMPSPLPDVASPHRQEPGSGSLQLPRSASSFNSPPSNKRANDVVGIRNRLQKLTKWTREGSMAVPVVKSFEEVMNNIFRSDDVSVKNSNLTEFKWPISIEFNGRKEDYKFHLSRQSSEGVWVVADPTAIEAVLSLWRFTLQQKELEFEQESRAMNGLGVSQYEAAFVWRLGESEKDDNTSLRDCRLWMYRGSEPRAFQTSFFERMCAQDLFSTFMEYAVETIQDLPKVSPTSKESASAAGEGWEPPTLRHPFLDSIIKAVARTGLGTSEEISMRVIPPLRSSGILERVMVTYAIDRASLFEHHKCWEKARKEWSWLYDTSLDYFQEDPTVFYRAAILLADFSARAQEAYLISEQKKSLNTTDLVTPTVSLKAFEKVRSGRHGAAIVDILSDAYGKTGITKALPQSPSLAEPTDTGEYPRAGQHRIRNLLKSKDNILGWTASHFAAAFGTDNEQYHDSKDTDGRTPLHWACLHGNFMYVEQLVGAGCDQNREDKLGRTPLSLAVVGNNIEIVRYLIDHNAQKDHADSDRWTALHWAVFKEKQQSVELLLELKCNLNSRDSEGRTPLHLAIHKERWDLVEKLLAGGASPDIMPKSGECALYSIAAGGSLEHTQLLLKYGANPSKATEYDWTPLHWAVGNGHKDVAKALLEKGANLSAVSDTGTTPMDMARTDDMRELLKKYQK